MINNENIAQRVSTFADSCIKSAAKHGETVESALNDAAKNARSHGKARHSNGQLLGFRFPDGSAVTANFVEFLGVFSGERAA